MGLRPEPARWFELLTSRQELTLALETLARTGSIELETHSDSRAMLNLPDLRDRMDEYDRLARRYHPYWPRKCDHLSCRTAPSGLWIAPCSICGLGRMRLRRGFITSNL